MYRLFLLVAAATSILPSSVAHADHAAPSVETPIVIETAPDTAKKPIWTGMVVTGGVVAGVSALWLGSGLALYLNDSADDADLFDGMGRELGAGFMITGAALAALSVPFLAVGFADPRAPSAQLEVVTYGAGLALRRSFQ